MIACTSCGRKLRSPHWIGGQAYGSKCVRSVAPMERAAAAVKAGRRRRAAHPIDTGRAFDPQQMVLPLEVPCNP